MLRSQVIALTLAGAALLAPVFVSEPQTAPAPAKAGTPASDTKPMPAEWKRFMQDVAWSPDGQRFAFSRYDAAGPYDGKNWTIWIVERDGSRPRAVLRGAVYASFSPDGQRIASSMLIDGDQEIVTVKVDGSDLRRVTRRPGKESAPAWSPDGKFLVYAAEVDANLDLYRIDVDGTNTTRLTSDTARDYNPAISRDGKRVVFYREVGDQKDQIWTLDLASGKETRITNGEGHSFYPAFLPDGRVGYSSQKPGGERRLVVSDGSKEEPVGPPGIFFARWSPDGKEILFLIAGAKGEIKRMALDGSGVAVRFDAGSLPAPAKT